jgi:hypothetical protein
MRWQPIIGRGMTVDRMQNYIDGLQFLKWKPSFMVLHNTGAPTLAQWHKVSGETRMQNLQDYFRGRGWSAGPHAFVADDLIWPFTPFTVPGVHSPSWNGTSLGVEMVADFATENPNAGAGLKVKQNTVALFAMLHAKLGINPDTIKLHKDDPLTTHDCPGHLMAIQKDAFIAAVHQYMGSEGEHSPGIDHAETHT